MSLPLDQKTCEKRLPPPPPPSLLIRFPRRRRRRRRRSQTQTSQEAPLSLSLSLFPSRLLFLMGSIGAFGLRAKHPTTYLPFPLCNRFFFIRSPPPSFPPIIIVQSWLPWRLYKKYSSLYDMSGTLRGIPPPLSLREKKSGKTNIGGGFGYGERDFFWRIPRNPLLHLIPHNLLMHNGR